MQQTPNYNLNLPEGTDVVNPLVDYNPNFSAIDGAMKANADRTVGRATCIKSGTTHVVTRSNTGSNIINFTATGDWNTGDTMTIDSVIVSVFLPDGSAALDGAYVINSEVFGILNGTRFTLYGAQELPGYTAADISYDNTDSGLDATDVQAAIDEVLGVAQDATSSVTALTASTAVGTVNDAYVYQNGNLKSIVVDMTLSQQILANTAIFSLAATALFPRNISCGQVIDMNNGQVTPVHINTSGTCVKSIPSGGDSSIASGHRIVITVTYIA